jgi:hypothetical protein
VTARPVDPVEGDPLAVYVVGEYLEEARGGGMAWRFIGVFADHDSALAACASVAHFIGPAKLGEPHDPAGWPGMYYPLDISPQTPLT